MGGLKFYHLPSANRKKEGSNPASYPKTAFGIYEIFNKKSGSKNPERLDAVGFAPTASKVLGCCGAGGGTRTHTMLPSADFESATSTIPSHRHAMKVYTNSLIISSPKIHAFACTKPMPSPGSLGHDARAPRWGRAPALPQGRRACSYPWGLRSPALPR